MKNYICQLGKDERKIKARHLIGLLGKVKLGQGKQIRTGWYE